MSTPDGRSVAVNRRAGYDYDILETVEAGIALTGTEIKSIRAGRVNLREAYARMRDDEMWLFGAHIAHYPAAGPLAQHDPVRPRKLLLHRSQIRRLSLEADRQRLTIIPLRLYIKDHRAKVELALARGRRQYDRRAAIAKREAGREMDRAMKERAR